MMNEFETFEINSVDFHKCVSFFTLIFLAFQSRNQFKPLLQILFRESSQRLIDHCKHLELHFFKAYSLRLQSSNDKIFLQWSERQNKFHEQITT